MIRRLFLALLLLAAMGGVCPAHALTPAQRVILLSQIGPSLDLNFTQMSALPGIVSFSRSSGATSALYTDAAGASFTTYTADQPRLSSDGLLIEEQRTNYLLNSGVPATQTTGSLATGSYIFFCNGTGSVTSSAGTAVATGLGSLTCSQSTYQSISVVTAGTLTFTVSGTVDWFDLQGGSFPTTHIVTAGTTATRSTDVAIITAFDWQGSNNLGNVGTIFTSFVEPATINANAGVVGATSGLFRVGLASGGGNGFIFDGGTLTNSSNLATANSITHVAASWNSVNQYVSLNNGAVAAGSRSGTISGNGLQVPAPVAPGQVWVRELKYWARTMQPGQLQQLR